MWVEPRIGHNNMVSEVSFDFRVSRPSWLYPQWHRSRCKVHVLHIKTLKWQNILFVGVYNVGITFVCGSWELFAVDAVCLMQSFVMQFVRAEVNPDPDCGA